MPKNEPMAPCRYRADGAIEAMGEDRVNAGGAHTDHSATDGVQLAALCELIAAQQERIASLEDAMARLTGASIAAAHPGGDQTRDVMAPASGRHAAHRVAARGRGGPDGASARRTLLKRAGVAAAALAATGLATATSAKAAGAADGGTVILGQTNTMSNPTVFNPVTGAGPTILLNADNSATTSTSQSTAGIQGKGPTLTGGANGVVGIANGAQGYGVFGQTDAGYGVVGQSTSGIDLYAAGTGRLQQVLQTAVGAPTAGAHAKGEQIRDANGDLWICVASGSPGQWRKAAALAPGNALGGSINLLGAPIRLLDTRAGAPTGNYRPNAPVAYHATLQMPAGGVTYAGQTIPTGAGAVFGNLIVALAPGVNPGAGSSLVAWATGATQPAAVAIVYNPGDLSGEYTGNFTLVGIGSGGYVNLYSQPINNVSVDLIFDAFGFVM